MHILLTGSAGSVGSAVLLYLLETSSHSITSLDINPLPPSLTSQIKEADAEKYTHHLVDLVDHTQLDRIFASHGPFDGVIHLSAIPNCEKHDVRVVHNVNVTTAYNVMRTAADYGVKRIVQASSVNAQGLSFTPEGRQRFDVLPMREEAAMRPMDGYGLSKQINEIQAECLVRTDPTLRIASLRLHWVVSSYADARSGSQARELFSWVSHRSCAIACLLALTSEGWEGAEVFNIAAPEICWEGGLSIAVPGHEGLEGKVGAVEVVKKAWDGRVGVIDEAYWAENSRRGLWDTGKAEKMLGWKHEAS